MGIFNFFSCKTLSHFFHRYSHQMQQLDQLTLVLSEFIYLIYHFVSESPQVLRFTSLIFIFETQCFLWPHQSFAKQCRFEYKGQKVFRTYHRFGIYYMWPRLLDWWIAVGSWEDTQIVQWNLKTLLSLYCRGYAILRFWLLPLKL